jgi:hypothetical protein
MQRYDIPVLPQQMAWLALLMIAPVALTFAIVFLSQPAKASAAAPILGATLFIVSGIFFAIVLRHAVEIDRAALTVRHSLYTLTIDRSDVTDVRPLRSLKELGLSTRTNGVAAFGYLSGWFQRARGERTFCAVSALPAYLITLKEGSPCRHLAVSAGPELARSIESWGSGR